MILLRLRIIHYMFITDKSYPNNTLRRTENLSDQNLVGLWEHPNQMLKHKKICLHLLKRQWDTVSECKASNDYFYSQRSGQSIRNTQTLTSLSNISAFSHISYLLSASLLRHFLTSCYTRTCVTLRVENQVDTVYLTKREKHTHWPLCLWQEHKVYR